MFSLISSHNPFNLYSVASVKNNAEYYDQHLPQQEKHQFNLKQWPSSTPKETEGGK